MDKEIALPPQESRSLAERLTPAQVKADYNLVLQVMGSCMKKDEDYGIVPGTGKPSLYKPGAEKLMLVFKLSGRPTIEDLSGPDERRYRVSTEIIHTPSGTIVGYGVGEASTNELKYKWRKAGKEEWDDTPEDRRRKKYGEKYPTLQVRTEPADLANTVLKMADKRSLISGILKVTAASSVFNQDLAEMDKDVREAVMQAELGTMPIPAPTRRSEATPPPLEGHGEAGSGAPEADHPTDEGNTPQGAGNESQEPPKLKVGAGWIAMVAKRESPCEDCADEVMIGDKVYWDAKSKRTHHAGHFA